MSTLFRFPTAAQYAILSQFLKSEADAQTRCASRHVISMGSLTAERSPVADLTRHVTGFCFGLFQFQPIPGLRWRDDPGYRVVKVPVRRGAPQRRSSDSQPSPQLSAWETRASILDRFAATASGLGFSLLAFNLLDLK